MPLALLLVLLTTMAGIDESTPDRVLVTWPAPLLTLQRWARPFASANAYGLFRVMTRDRPELIIEGSQDGTTWLPYEFKWKPGDVNRRPAYCIPHMPRLDWQIWTPFLGARLGQTQWLLQFLDRLLKGQPQVLALLEHNPFPNTPPSYLRVLVYDYRFTTFDERARTGAWWHRTYRGPYGPAIKLGPGDQLVPADVPNEPADQ